MNTQLLQLEAHANAPKTVVALGQGNNIPFAIRRVYHMSDTGKGFVVAIAPVSPRSGSLNSFGVGDWRDA